MNLDKIFDLNIIKLWTKYDYIFSLEILGVLKWFKKIAKLEPFTINDLYKVKDLLNNFWLKYKYFIKNEYFDEKEMLFKKWYIKWKQYIDLYISLDNKYFKIFEKDINIKEKNFIIWKLLWYPECCIKFFLKKNYTSDFDFNIMIKNITVWNLDWRLNNLINPYSLIPFFPCSYNCKNAIEYAEKNLKILWNREKIEKIFKNKILYKWFWEYKIVKNIKHEDIKNIFDFS